MEELVAEGLPLHTVEDQSIVQFHQRPRPSAALAEELEGYIAEIEAVGEEAGITFVHEFRMFDRLSVFATGEDPEGDELEVLRSSVEFLNEWRETIDEPVRSLISVEGPRIYWSQEYEFLEEPELTQ